jgi:beta-galactosidase
MKLQRWLCRALVLLTATHVWCQTINDASSRSITVHTFAVGNDGQFRLDNRPFQIHAGSMHYPRVPRAEWRDRMRKMKAMGLNTLTTYVFWNVHETSPGHFDFSGQNDLGEYLQEAQQEGLHVILRPGPYVCAEWEFGGFPAWLLKNHAMKIRSRDPLFMTAVSEWFDRLGQVVHPMMLSQGGPIIAVQVENEYGAFGDDHQYMEAIKAALQHSGMGDGYLFTSDGPDYFEGGSLPELPVAVNFGAGGAKMAFAALKAWRPDGPMMSGEYWDGWFDHWGDVHQERPAEPQEREIKWMLDHDYSFDLYMIEGGTTFGWMNGANSDGRNYEPDTTSYDYDVPIDERGGLRAKYFALQAEIAQASGIQPADPPAASKAVVYPIRPLMESASLWDNLPSPHRSREVVSMEDLDQAYGYILYTTKLPNNGSGKLEIHEVHDFDEVYVDHNPIGTLDRRLGQGSLTLPSRIGGQELAILVENTGRVNYTSVMRGERKGITSRVVLSGVDLHGWKVYSLQMRDTTELKYKVGACFGPCFFKSTISVGRTSTVPLDTYINTTSINKGMIWVNGLPLGRFWFIGPQGALYLPGSWLHSGPNELTCFDLESAGSDSIATVAHPIFFLPIPAANIHP